MGTKLARNVDFSQTIVDCQQKLKESSMKLQTSEVQCHWKNIQVHFFLFIGHMYTYETFKNYHTLMLTMTTNTSKHIYLHQ
jgi:hypothetical protein